MSMATFRDGNTLSTKIHYRNKHNQECLGHRGGRGNHCTETEGGKSIWQTAYKMRCQSCGHVYGANGCDVWQRKCPRPKTECPKGGGKAGIPY